MRRVNWLGHFWHQFDVEEEKMPPKKDPKTFDFLRSTLF